ncbi:SEC14 domain and spectrin repeat-containing protein 1-B-like, partial [Mytilus edulis]
MRRGVTVVIDSRDGSWSNLVTVLGCLKESLGDLLKQVLVVKPDSHTDRRPSSNSFRRDRPNIEPQFVTVNRLYTFVDRNQLTAMFDGTLSYRHDIWLRNRL